MGRVNPNDSSRRKRTARAPRIAAALLAALFGGAAARADAPAPTPPVAPAAPIDVWFDIDASTGVTRGNHPRDCDDGLALLFGMHSPEVVVRGVSATYGNAELSDAVPIARDIVGRFGPPGLEVRAGAAGPGDFGHETDATRAMEAALKERPLVVLALGPLTDVASVLSMHPDLKDRVTRVVVVAARRPGFDFHPPGRPEVKFPDYNFECDVPAAQALLDSGVPVTFAGYEVSSDTWITRADLDRLATTTDAGKWVARSSDYWLRHWETVLKLGGFNPFDTLAVAAVARPEFVTSIPVTAHIATGPNDRAPGRLPATVPTKAYLIAEPSADANSRYRYCTAADPGFAAFLIDRLARRPETPGK